MSRDTNKVDLLLDVWLFSPTFQLNVPDAGKQPKLKKTNVEPNAGKIRKMKCSSKRTFATLMERPTFNYSDG